MKNNLTIIIYLLTFLILSLVLKLFNVINISISELFGYTLIFFGINLVYTSLGKSRRGTLFSGTFIFLLGMLLFIINNFSFLNTNELIFPSLLFILGICFLMLFFDDMTGRKQLIISITLIITGTFVTIFAGTLTLSSFFSNIPVIISKYWIAGLIIIGMILLINRDLNRK